MSNNPTPDAAAVFMKLENRDLAVRSMNIEKDDKNQPLAAHFTLKTSPEKIPSDLDLTMRTHDRVVPVIYHAFQNG